MAHRFESVRTWMVMIGAAAAMLSLGSRPAQAQRLSSKWKS